MIYGFKANHRREIASLTKIMTLFGKKNYIKPVINFLKNTKSILAKNILLYQNYQP